MRLPSGYVTCCDSPFSDVYEWRAAVYISRCHVIITRSNHRYPIIQRVARTCCGSQNGGVSRVVSRLLSFLLLFDYQEAFHCLVVACINRINMISIQCHRVGQWWAGNRQVKRCAILWKLTTQPQEGRPSLHHTQGYSVNRSLVSRRRVTNSLSAKFNHCSTKVPILSHYS